jgi:hypothetical protein
MGRENGSNTGYRSAPLPHRGEQDSGREESEDEKVLTHIPHIIIPVYVAAQQPGEAIRLASWRRLSIGFRAMNIQ